jgi:tetratricopeptide (TPR) repeat protein
MSMAKVAGMPDLSGAAALNLGTLIQKTGDFARAREMFAESMTSFAFVKNSAHQVVALFNMAHCEREQGLWESAAELYATTSSLAERIGHGDLEIGSLAGAGLCSLELGRLDKAREAEAEVRQTLDRRPEWFQGREVAEALIVRVELMGGNTDSAFARLEWAAEMAAVSDQYVAIWLVLSCAPALLEHDPARARRSIDRYGGSVAALGFPDLTRRFQDLAARSEAALR